MTRNIWIGIVVVIALVAGGWWYLNQSSAPAISETTQFPTTQQNVNTNSSAATNTDLKSYRNDTFGFEFKYSTTPDKWGYVTNPVTSNGDSKPWLFNIQFCSQGTCGMGNGDSPDFGIQKYSGQNISVDLLKPDDQGFSLNGTPLSVAPITIDGHKGTLMTYNYTFGAQSGTFREVSVQVADKLFVFGLVDDNASNSALFDSIVSTLRFY